MRLLILYVYLKSYRLMCVRTANFIKNLRDFCGAFIFFYQQSLLSWVLMLFGCHGIRFVVVVISPLVVN